MCHCLLSASGWLRVKQRLSKKGKARYDKLLSKIESPANMLPTEETGSACPSPASGIFAGLFLFGGNMRKIIWIMVLSWIERFYAGSTKNNASQVVDCCIFLKEAIRK